MDMSIVTHIGLIRSWYFE